jgi:branched-chain amino acid transport system ATP-binding protein
VLERLAALPPSVTLLLIEHNLEAAFAVVSTATVLNLGQVIAHGDVATVRASPLVQEVYLAGGQAGSVVQS